MTEGKVLHEVVLDDDVPGDEGSETGRRDFLKVLAGVGLGGVGTAILAQASIVSTFLTARPAMAAPTGYLVWTRHCVPGAAPAWWHAQLTITMGKSAWSWRDLPCRAIPFTRRGNRPARSITSRDPACNVPMRLA